MGLTVALACVAPLHSSAGKPELRVGCARRVWHNPPSVLRRGRGKVGAQLSSEKSLEVCATCTLEDFLATSSAAALLGWQVVLHSDGSLVGSVAEVLRCGVPPLPGGAQALAPHTAPHAAWPAVRWCSTCAAAAAARRPLRRATRWRTCCQRSPQAGRRLRQRTCCCACRAPPAGARTAGRCWCRWRRRWCLRWI